VLEQVLENLKNAVTTEPIARSPEATMRQAQSSNRSLFQRILVAVEPTTASLLVDQAIALAQLHQSQLCFTHIGATFDDSSAASVLYPGIDALYPTFNSPVLQHYSDEWVRAEARNRDWLRTLVQAAADAGVPADIHQQLGEPGPLLCQIAREQNIDLILVGRRGRSGLSELFLGSVSNYVLHHSPCAVLTLQVGTLQMATAQATASALN
jgi:nucleotide-binding universal stress UspA family protein